MAGFHCTNFNTSGIASISVITILTSSSPIFVCKRKQNINNNQHNAVAENISFLTIILIYLQKHLK